jgi:hypothetical protein
MHSQYKKTLERLFQLFTTCPDPNTREHEDGWSIKEILGHLVDSSSNNHQRLARYQAQGHFQFPGYDQNIFVQRVQYDSFDFRMLVSLWYQYNQLLLHLIKHIPHEDLTSTITVGDRPTVTLEHLIDDYFAHMEVHERQILRILNRERTS